MDKHIKQYILVVWLLAGCVYCAGLRATSNDPCLQHIVIDQPFMDVSYRTLTKNASSVLYITWYRHLSSGQGSLAMTCPTGTQCGTLQPVWMNDAIPSYGEDSKEIKVCYKNGTDCCAYEGRVRVKNCNAFLVYFIMPQVPPVRWCFDKSLTPLESDEEVAGSGIELIAGAAGGGLVAIGLVVGMTAVIRRKKIKANTVNTSKSDSNPVVNGNNSMMPTNGH